MFHDAYFCSIIYVVIIVLLDPMTMLYDPCGSNTSKGNYCGGGLATFGKRLSTKT